MKRQRIRNPLRVAAEAAGQMRFHSGRDCNRGHKDPLREIGGRCIQCKKLTNSQPVNKVRFKWWARTPKGRATTAFCSARVRARENGVEFALTQGKLVAWTVKDAQFKKLHAAWAQSGHRTKNTPALTRIDRAQPYELGNVVWVTRREISFGREAKKAPASFLSRIKAGLKSFANVVIEAGAAS